MCKLIVTVLAVAWFLMSPVANGGARFDSDDREIQPH